ncbi:MAG: 50S ribosomal protein L17 [Rickettsiales bacterium]|jgi:large subunit ribosomal protein L17|nr:50S ribosomal protein L17 [Rickettsiales bacterium]
MRHGISGRKLNRPTSHRKSLLENLSISLIKSEQIKTTLPKAKELRSFIEKLVTIGKGGALADRRRILSVVKDNLIANKLFEISNRFKDRNGGYTRVLKCGFRTGDMAPMAIIEFVDRVVKE